MIERALDELAAALHQDGVRGRAGRRVLAEARDHLEEAAARVGEVDAIRAFGSPRELAGIVAAEVATTATRSAALSAFAVLGFAGLVYAVLFLTIPLAGSPDIFGGGVPGLGIVAFIGIVFAPQVAFVSGCLALIRVIRVRRLGALGADELRQQRWRTGLAIGAGAATFVSLALAALDFRRDLAGWWVAGTLAASAVVVLALGAVAATSVRSRRPRVSATGTADDVFDDLAPVLGLTALRRLALPGHPWRFAVLVAVAAAVPVALGGVAGGDPFDGLLRATSEIVAVLACFGIFGRPLGLRRS
ncbi:MAG: hypothetical protein ABI927_01855 [Gaiellaceae bacterium]